MKGTGIVIVGLIILYLVLRKKPMNESSSGGGLGVSDNSVPTVNPDGTLNIPSGSSSRNPVKRPATSRPAQGSSKR